MYVTIVIRTLFPVQVRVLPAPVEALFVLRWVREEEGIREEAREAEEEEEEEEEAAQADRRHHQGGG